MEYDKPITITSAVNTLIRVLGDDDLFKRRKELIKYVKNHPEETEVAESLEFYLNAIGEVRKSKWLWIARDYRTGRIYKAPTAKALGRMLLVPANTIVKGRTDSQIVKSRYEISRKPNRK